MTAYVTSRDGAVVRVGDWVHYCGTLTQHRGQSVRPCGDELAPCGCGAA